MNYNVVLLTTVQQNDPLIHKYGIYLFFFIFFSIMVYYGIWNIVPCAIL